MAIRIAGDLCFYFGACWITLCSRALISFLRVKKKATGPFHILVISKQDFELGAKKATEIHTGQEVALKDLGNKKVSAVPAVAE